jgi:hypothetical protein
MSTPTGSAARASCETARLAYRTSGSSDRQGCRNRFVTNVVSEYVLFSLGERRASGPDFDHEPHGLIPSPRSISGASPAKGPPQGPPTAKRPRPVFRPSGGPARDASISPADSPPPGKQQIKALTGFPALFEPCRPKARRRASGRAR